MSKKSANAVAVASKMSKGRKPVKVSNKAPTSRNRKPAAVVLVTDEPKSPKTLPPPAAAKRAARSTPSITGPAPAKLPPLRDAVRAAEREIEQAAARGNRKLVEKLTKQPKAAPVSKPVKAAALQPHPRSKTIAGVVELYLDSAAKESSEAYIKSIGRPLAAFVKWCQAKHLAPSAIDAKVLERYRKHVEGLGRALSTTRMELARVQTCLRVMGWAQADIAVLRVQHTEEEKEARSEAAQIASEE
jgi:hypothetical protein